MQTGSGRRILSSLSHHSDILNGLEQFQFKISVDMPDDTRACDGGDMGIISNIIIILIILIVIINIIIVIIIIKITRIS